MGVFVYFLLLFGWFMEPGGLMLWPHRIRFAFNPVENAMFSGLDVDWFETHVLPQ